MENNENNNIGNLWHDKWIQIYPDDWILKKIEIKRTISEMCNKLGIEYKWTGKFYYENKVVFELLLIKCDDEKLELLNSIITNHL